MISVQEVIPDPDMTDPQPFTISRSAGQWVAGGFQSTVVRTLQIFGTVRNATDKEVAMLPEADRVGRVRAFYATMPILTTRGYAPAPSVHAETPTGAVPGTVYTLSALPPNGMVDLYLNGLRQTPGSAYILLGTTLTLAMPTSSGDLLCATWPITVNAQAAESDTIAYDGFVYRVLSVYRTNGGGYWKALGTRIEAS